MVHLTEIFISKSLCGREIDIVIFFKKTKLKFAAIFTGGGWFLYVFIES